VNTGTVAQQLAAAVGWMNAFAIDQELQAQDMIAFDRPDTLALILPQVAHFYFQLFVRTKTDAGVNPVLFKSIDRSFALFRQVEPHGHGQCDVPIGAEWSIRVNQVTDPRNDAVNIVDKPLLESKLVVDSIFSDQGLLMEFLPEIAYIAVE
jgi:hypothetical protein